MPETNETLSDQTEKDQQKDQQNDQQDDQQNDQQDDQQNDQQDDQQNDQKDDQQNETDQTSSTIDRQKAKDALKSISPPAGRRKRRHYAEEDILLRFTSCGRCGLFLTTYRLSHNQELIEAIEDIEADWLILPWHPGMRELVNKSYGSPVDIESYFLEGTCPECHRSFSYAEPDPEQPAWFLVKL